VHWTRSTNPKERQEPIIKPRLHMTPNYPVALILSLATNSGKRLG
jgi:hypothetical protein